MNWKAILGWILAIFAGLIIVVTFLSAIESPLWWIRVWDFPRLLITVCAIVLLIFVLFTDPPARILLAVGLVAAIGFQAWHIYPYTALAKVEAQSMTVDNVADEPACFSVLSVNVLQQNRDYQRTIDLIAVQNADIVLLMETDQAWLDAVSPVLSDYPTRYEVPLPNMYGMILATRLDVDSAHIMNLTQPGTPSIHAVMRSPDGRRFRLAALHPRPPQPGHDTAGRDAELVVAARFIRNSDLPALAVGDFNDVGWSRTSQLFRRIGEYVDPRIGRGFFATFPAQFPAFRWPLDHMFFTEEFVLSSMRVERPVGSDHLPVYGELCLSEQAGEILNETPDADAEDFEDAEDIMVEYQESEIWEHTPQDQ